MSPHAGEATPTLRHPLVAVGLAWCAAAVLVAAVFPAAAGWTIAGIAAGAVVSLAVLSPRWALLLLLAVEATNASSVVGPVAGLSLYTAILAIASASLLLGLADGRVRLRGSPVLLLAAVFVAAQAPSVLAASDRTVAWAALLDLTKDLWFLVVVVLLALATVSAWTLARVFTGSMTLLSALALVNQFVLANATAFGGFAVVSESTGVGVATARHAASFEDPNFWGRLLLLAVPLAVALAGEAWQREARRTAALWGTAVLLLSGGVYLTQSRGALLALGVATVLFLALLGPRSRRRLLLLPAAVAIIALLPGVGSRLATLGEVTGSASGPQDYSLVERLAAQQISLAIFLDHPGTGVGPANIPVVWAQYDTRAGIEVQRQVAPHNLYLQLAAEGGLIGLTGALVFLLGVLVVTARLLPAYPLTVGGRAPPERLLVVALVAAFVAWGVASLFLHLSHLRPLLAVVAIAAVLHHRVPRSTPPPRRVRAYARGDLRRTVSVGAAATLALGVVTAVTVGVLSQPVWAVRIPVTVLPRPIAGAGGYVDPYSHEVITLPGVMATYAAAVEEAGVAALRPQAVPAGYRVTAREASSSAVLVVEVEGPRRSVAARLARTVAGQGTARVNATPSMSRLATATAGAVTSERDRRWSSAGLLVLGGGLPLVVWAGARLSGRRRPRGRRHPG